MDSDKQSRPRLLGTTIPAALMRVSLIRESHLRGGQPMSRYINFTNLHPPSDITAAHVLNGSGGQKRMSLCRNKWEVENEV